MENIIKSYCDHIVAFDKAKDAENWVKKSMAATLNDIRNELKKTYPFLNEYSDYDYLYLAFYCEENGLDFVKTATEVLNSEDHDVYGYIDELNHQKYNDEILDTIKPGMSVELANGYRYDVVDMEYCGIILVNYEDILVPSVSLKNYSKDGRCNKYLNDKLDIVAIYENNNKSPWQKALWKRQEEFKGINDLKNGMYVVFRCGVWASVVRDESVSLSFCIGSTTMHSKKISGTKYDREMHHKEDADYDIIEVRQYGECIWKEKNSEK